MAITLSFASLLFGNLSQVSGLTMWDCLTNIRGQPNLKAQGPIKITYAYSYVYALRTRGTHREASYFQSLRDVHSFTQRTRINMPCARSTYIVECAYCREHKHNHNTVSKDCLDEIILMSLF